MTILLWCLKASVSVLIAKYYQRFALIGIQNSFHFNTKLKNKQTNKQKMVTIVILYSMVTGVMSSFNFNNYLDCTCLIS